MGQCTAEESMRTEARGSEAPLRILQHAAILAQNVAQGFLSNV